MPATASRFRRTERPPPNAEPSWNSIMPSRIEINWPSTRRPSRNTSVSAFTAVTTSARVITTSNPRFLDFMRSPFECFVGFDDLTMRTFHKDPATVAEGFTKNYIKYGFCQSNEQGGCAIYGRKVRPSIFHVVSRCSYG